MSESFRAFEAGPDPFGQTWQVEFRWIQNAISIRHADAVDVKFFLRCGDTLVEKVVAIPHPWLVRLAQENSRLLSDPWVSSLAAQHIRKMVETGEDIEKTLVSPSWDELRSYDRAAATAKR